MEGWTELPFPPHKCGLAVLQVAMGRSTRCLYPAVPKNISNILSMKYEGESPALRHSTADYQLLKPGVIPQHLAISAWPTQHLQSLTYSVIKNYTTSREEEVFVFQPAPPSTRFYWGRFLQITWIKDRTLSSNTTSAGSQNPFFTCIMSVFSQFWRFSEFLNATSGSEFF